MQGPLMETNSVINRALIFYLTIFPCIKQTQTEKNKKESGSVFYKNHCLVLVICCLFNQAEVTH